MIAEYNGLGNLVAEYVYGNNQRLARINSDKTIDYYLNDHPAKAGQALGSARTMTSSGWSANYYPFGEIASQSGSPEDTRYDYTGQERDRETGLIYFRARYYDPGIGRWMSVDPNSLKYQSFSPYSYCYNNPQNHVDPQGKDGIKIGFGGVGFGAWFNIKLNLTLSYDFRTGFKVRGSYGFGGSKFTKGLGGALYASGTYYTGQLKDGISGYVVGTKNKGFVTGISSISVPWEDVEKVTDPLDIKQISAVSVNKQVEIGIGVGVGSGFGGGFKEEKTLLDMSHPPKENLNMNNQTGQAPADATNVVPSIEVDGLYSNPEGAIVRSLMHSALGIDSSKSSRALWDKMQGNK
ncbi:MAG: tRNA(Glu)-specific nuclease WapA precursor [Syntrophorhabdus sp. PtaB.Bin027]|nr:MAG: tRNA(Glu)-specific nuclease WapA precursor [Syntrophorhabdus sp. PtaB.Bin027]